MGAPLFKKITANLENGKQIVINAPANSEQNRYINTLRMNGKLYGKNWLSHRELMQGAVLDVDMSATPNQQRGIKPDDFPYSFSTAEAK